MSTNILVMMSQQKVELYSKIDAYSDQESDIEDQNVKIYSKKRKSKGLIVLMLNPWFMLYTLCLLAAVLFIPFWFYNHDIDFYICGAFGIIMLMFSIWKFYTLFGDTKRIIRQRKYLNRKLELDNRRLRAQIERTCNAIKILRDTKKRITNINIKNRNNVKSFESIEEEISNAGLKNNIYTKAITIGDEWQNEYIKNEKKTLHLIYDRFIQQKRADNQQSVLQTLNREQFDEFQYNILPIVYRSTLAKLNVFEALDVNNNGRINVEQVKKYLDKMAENMDIFIENENDNESNNIEKYAAKQHVQKSEKTKPNDNEQHNTPKRKDSLFDADYDITDTKEDYKTPKRKDSLFADDYDIINENNNDNYNEKSISTTNIPKRKDSLFADDYDIVIDESTDHYNEESMATKPPRVLIATYDDKSHDKKLKRKIGKLKHKWGDTPTTQSGSLHTPTNKVVNADGSWVKHKSMKAIHPIHESVDALQRNKLVSKSKANIFAPSDSSIAKPGKVKLPQTTQEEKKDLNTPKRKESLPDESWIKHTPPKKAHPKHESVNELALNRLVSQSEIIRKLSTVGEDENDLDEPQND